MKLLLNILSILGLMLILYQLTSIIKKEILVSQLNKKANSQLKVGKTLIEATEILDMKYWDVVGRNIYLNNIRIDTHNDSTIVYYLYPCSIFTKGIEVEFNPCNNEIISIKR